MALPVLYDGDCGFCRWSLAKLLARDPDGTRLRPVRLDSDEGRALLAAMPEAERMRAAHAVTPDGAVHTGGDAVAPILRALGRPRAAAVAVALGPALRPGYRLVARSRGLLGRFLSG